MIKNWILSLIGQTKSVAVGTRIRYQGYEGTVTGGCLYVKFDRRAPFMSPKSDESNLQYAFNIDKKNVEII